MKFKPAFSFRLFCVKVKKMFLFLIGFLQGVKGERGFAGPTGDKGDEVSWRKKKFHLNI